MKQNRNMFARAIAMFSAINAAMALPFEQRDAALGKVGLYKSRGKGRGTPSRRYGNRPGRYMPHQGDRECFRRRIGGFYYERSVDAMYRASREQA